MAKRKASRTPRSAGFKDVDAADARLVIQTFEDVADDREQYFLDKDKLILEDEPDSKRIRTQDRVNEFLESSDEEVLRASHQDSDDSEEDDCREQQKAVKVDHARENIKEHKRAKKLKKLDEKEEEGQEHGAIAEGDDGWWGESKKEYYNADAIETEVDALEEEEEAKRLQGKKLAEMDEADFILDEHDWATPANEAHEEAHVFTEELHDIEIADNMSADERCRLLQARYPELPALLAEFGKLQPQLAQLQEEAEGRPPRSVQVVRHWILGCYVAALASYFAILTSPAREANRPKVSLCPADLREHEVMETLVTCREAWQKAKALKPSDTTSQGMRIDLGAEEDPPVVGAESEPAGWATERMKVDGDCKKKEGKHKGKKERKNERKVDQAVLDEAKEVEESLADLSTWLAKSKKATAIKASATTRDDDHSDFGDEEALDTSEAVEKVARKKSLRFYTSQIVQKASRRADAGRDAGGDVDIPYRERLKDRQIRLNREAERRGKKDFKHGAALGEGNSSGDEAGGDEAGGDEAVAKKVRAEEEDYYDMIAHRAEAKKHEKAALKEALAAASRADRVIEVTTVGEDGKRKINYQIKKNKGLTPKRNKDVRNPRVKRRKKFEEKQKKLRSMKAVYQGGEGHGGYQGEKSGIKTGLVKSVKL